VDRDDGLVTDPPNAPMNEPVKTAIDPRSNETTAKKK
jgi:hypothetical protein